MSYVSAPGRVRIKLCGVRRPQDAVLCAEAGADEVGVIFAATSRRCVTIEQAKAIRAALPAGVRLIGVFVDVEARLADQVASEVGLDGVQLHGRWPAPLPRTASTLALQVKQGSLAIPPQAAGAQRILLDGPQAGSGESFAWSLAAEARRQWAGELFVAGGLSPDNVAVAIAAAHPDGVDVASGIEGPDGFKDPHRVRAFIAAARGAAGRTDATDWGGHR